ncbi:conserved Plasmodium protein, unknown function [Plasmodium gallinaceum]|uniref:Uncharacterized protein n=1 Tax=Plasmodium gallinaceum TaxID=5849 RepID=A0A1J1H0A7_PLAGA|nr:conserved Plasmodium protein, unknown function [Plasmodium gallinaceum]CRG97883.1 conserved Plasmodium protein, unknown function [Plasmodium gallinaceum]
MNSLLFKNKASNNEMDKIFNENNEAIISIENKKIVFPHKFKKCIIQNAFSSVLSPLKIEHNNILTKNSKISNIFSPRKKKTKLKNREDIYKKEASVKYNKEISFSNNINLCNMELFDNNNFESQINNKIMKKKFFERNFYSKYSNLENFSTDEVNDILENYDYSTNYIIKNRDFKDFQGKHDSKLTNKIGNINNLYSNKIQIINYNINFVEHNSVVNPIIQHECNRKFPNGKWIMENDKINKEIKTFHNCNITADTKLNRENSIYVNCENELQKIHSLSLKDMDTKVTGDSIKQVSEVVDTSRQHFSICDDISPLIKKKIKKGKKKNKGACFFNLNNFSCQFLMSCSKT